MAEQDPFAAIGGGVKLPNGGWVPNNHPDAIAYQQSQQSQPASAGQAALAPGATSGAPGTESINQQGINAQTYSTTPGAAPTANTSNQGTQDVVRNSYIQQATQGTSVDRTAPEFRQQVEPFAAAQERARRQYESEAAERLSARGLGSSGAMENERRLGMERAGQATGSFESMLVQRELQNRRDEIKEALTNLRGMISNDQAMALQRELAELDAALKREGVGASTRLGYAELGLKDKLGTGALNVDMLRALLQNQQFGDDLGFRIGDAEARWNNAALQSLF